MVSAPACLQASQPLGSIVPHAGHQQAHGIGSELHGNRAEHDVDRGAMAIDLGLVGEHNHISQGHAPDFHMAVTGAD